MRLLAPFLVAVIGWLIVATSGVDARDVVATNFNAPSVDLTSVIEYLETSEKEIVVPVPGNGDNTATAMTVTAKGPGDQHRFAVVTLYNEEPLPREMVLVSRWPGFVGSGLFWPHFGGSQLLSVQAAPGLPPKRLTEAQSDTYALTLDPGETVTVVAELVGQNLANLSLWHKIAYDKQQQQLSFFRGVVLGIATLTAVFMVCLFIIRLQPAFPAAALFAFASVIFIALEFGYLPVLQPLLPNATGLEVRVRSLVEVLMAAGALGCLITFLELRRRTPSIGYPLMGVFAGSLLLAACAWFAPEVCMGLARVLLLLTAVGGFGLIVVQWRQGMIRAQASLVTWCFLLLWTLCSTAAALGLLNLEVVSPVLAWGLVLVLLTMAFTLTQFAFNQGVVNSRFFEDSGRRGLALAGAEQVIWDWHEENGTLFVGPELERVLGHTQGRITRGGLKGWLELIHPSDRGDYVGVVESAVQRGRGTFGHQFRLRRGDGTYRWFSLRARSLPGDLGRAVRCIGTLSDITAAKRSEEQLLADSVRDRITGLPYEALFMDRLERAMQRADAEENDGLYLLIVDLDRFKHVNESLGFAVGDSLLLTIARRLTSTVGADDTLARMHGDRFAIILNTRSPERNLDAYIEHLRKLVARPVPLKPQEVFLTACIGIAQYKLDKTRPTQLLKDAETALYRAKQQGKDALVTFTDDMREGAGSMRNLEEDLRLALERHQIEIAYQPVMRLDNRRLAGFEALVRWRHTEYGLLEPDAFMRLAEDLGLMNEFGRFVLSQATRQLGIWQRAYRSDEPLFMTVNVSSRELIHRDLVDEVKTVLSREDLVPGTLKLELTETVLMENPELSIKILEKLQQAGVGICCDDFGTGYSALAHLRRLPFDTIKIDQSFLDGEADDEAAQIILEAIVLLAHDLGMTTVVEGIETSDQADRLRELGCDYGQGYLFGEPMSARQVMEAFGGSQSISGRATRKGIPSAAFWQKIIRRNDDGAESGETRRGEGRAAKVGQSAGFDAERLAAAEAQVSARDAEMVAIMDDEPQTGAAPAAERKGVTQEARGAVNGSGQVPPTVVKKPMQRPDSAVAAEVATGAAGAAAGAVVAAGASAAAAAKVATPAVQGRPGNVARPAGSAAPGSGTAGSGTAASGTPAAGATVQAPGAAGQKPITAQAQRPATGAAPMPAEATPTGMPQGQAARRPQAGAPRPLAVRMPLKQQGAAAGAGDRAPGAASPVAAAPVAAAPVAAAGNASAEATQAERPAQGEAPNAEPAEASAGNAPANTPAHAENAAATVRSPLPAAAGVGAKAVAGSSAIVGAGLAARPLPGGRTIPAPSGIGGRVPGAVPPGPVGGPLRGLGLGQHGRAGYAPAALAASGGWHGQKPAASDRANVAGPVGPNAVTEQFGQPAAAPEQIVAAVQASTLAEDRQAEDRQAERLEPQSLRADQHQAVDAPETVEAPARAADEAIAGRDVAQAVDDVVARASDPVGDDGDDAEITPDTDLSEVRAAPAVEDDLPAAREIGDDGAELVAEDGIEAQPQFAAKDESDEAHLDDRGELHAGPELVAEAVEPVETVADGEIPAPIEDDLPALAEAALVEEPEDASEPQDEMTAFGQDEPSSPADITDEDEADGIVGEVAIPQLDPSAEEHAAPAAAEEEAPSEPVNVPGDLVKAVVRRRKLNGSHGPEARDPEAAEADPEIPDFPASAAEQIAAVLQQADEDYAAFDDAASDDAAVDDAPSLSPPPRNASNSAPRPKPPLRRLLRQGRPKADD